MANGAVADMREEWEDLLVTTETNAKDLAFLEPVRLGLGKELEGLKEASIRQSTFKAQFQQATRDLEGHISRGSDLATRLRNGIRSAYGIKGEKLAEFGLQPRRNRSKKRPQEPSPAPTADSKTGSTTKE